MYKLELFTEQMEFADAAQIDVPTIDLDYLTFSAFSITSKTVKCQKGYFAHITENNSLVADCIVSDVQQDTGTVSISMRPLQALFDVDVFSGPISDAASWLLNQIEAQFVSNPDVLQNRPVTISSTVRTAYPLTIGDDDTINLVDIMAQMLTTYGIYIDAHLDMSTMQIVVSIVPPAPQRTFEADLDNVLDKTITLGDSYGSANKMIIRKRVTDEDTNTVSYPSQEVFYLHPDGTVDTTNSDRITPVFWLLENLDDSDTWEQEALDRAKEALTPQQYDNEVTLQYRARDSLVDPENAQIGTPCTIKSGGLSYSSILTGRAIGAGTVTLTFGAVRVALTKKLILQRRTK